MLYFFYGTDTDKSRARAKAVIGVMKQKRPDAEYFRVTAQNWDSATAEQFIEGQGLFERKFIVFFDGVFELADAKNWLTEHAQQFGKSENAFVVLEPKVDASTLKSFEKHTQETKKFDIEKTSRFAKGEFNAFALADALGEREGKRLWVLLSEAFMNGSTPEELNGILFWQVKSILVASESKTATESGLKPFVYSKSKRFALKYKHNELLNVSRELVSLYHDAHRGLRDFSSGLERFALSI